MEIRIRVKKKSQEMSSTYLEKEMDAEMKELEGDEDMEDSDDDKDSGNTLIQHVQSIFIFKIIKI